MQPYICATCGVQYAASDPRPAHGPIGEDERQYVAPNGQQWTTLAELRATRHNVIAEEEPGLTGIRTEERFGIGQRALVVQTPAGNILWECVSLVDDATVAAVRELG